jgi:Luciferase-like monooxygenase
MELGIYTFAELTPDPRTGRTVSPEQRLSDLIEEIELADELGLDVFGVGEHHRPDFSVSAPAVVLGAAATRTKAIRLSSAVTVLSSDDPVRVFQDFATLDALAIIGGLPERFAQFAELHRHAAKETGHGELALSINSHGFIADTSQQAADEAFPAFKSSPTSASSCSSASARCRTAASCARSSCMEPRSHRRCARRSPGTPTRATTGTTFPSRRPLDYTRLAVPTGSGADSSIA